MPRRFAYLFAAAVSVLCLCPALAQAACSTPAGNEGEFFYNGDFKVMQFCDGTNWIGMSGGVVGGGGGGITDGDKGDVTVSGSGASWNVDNSTITYAKIQNVSAANKILGRATTGAGAVEEITLGSGLTLTGTTLSATGSSSGAAGYIQFSGGSGAFASSSTTAGNQFFWDETNHRLGIGLAVPTQAIDVVGKITANSIIAKGIAGASAPVGGSGTWLNDGTNVWRATGNVGAGTSAPTSRIHINSTNNINTGSNFANGIGAFRIQDASSVGLLFDTNQIEQTDTTNAIYLNYNSAANAVLNMGGGSVGIGTTSPAAKLSFGTSGNLNTLHIYDGGGAGAHGFGFTPNTLNIYADATATTNASIAFGKSDKSTFTEWMRVKNGNVGIGTTSPAALLHIVGTARFDDTATTGVGSKGVIVRNDSTQDYLNIWNHSADTFAIESADQTTYRNLSLQPHGGNVGIGTASPATTLDVVGTFRVSSNAALNGAVAMNAIGNNAAGYYLCDNSGVISYGASCASSDIRLKKDIAPLTHSLERISQLRPVSFQWIDAKNRGEGTNIGLIAQDVEKIFPEFVSTNPDGYKSIQYEKIVAPLIDAVKELKADNDNMRAEIEALKSNR